jgi:hypothetical protein
MNKTAVRRLVAGTILILASLSHGARYTITTMAEITAALGNVAAGDTILVRAGTYAASTSISLTISGTSAKKISFIVYPGDQRPLFDFSSMPVGSSNRGIRLSGSYWYIKGLRIKGAGDNGMNISGSSNVIEYCDFFENQDSGCQLGGGAANNQIINCDSYCNVDPGQGNADGFSPKLDVGTGNYFKGCRSWQNSDDGYDGYLRPSDDITTTYENCWCCKNGYLKDGSASSGNGNGFKMGGSDNKDLRHNAVLKNCLSVGNRVKGFDQNNDKGSMTLYNCTGFNNGTNYQINGTILAGGKSLTITNCISAGTGGVSLTGGAITTCSWSAGFSVSNADFISVDPTAVIGARKADGSLPDMTFMHLQTNPKSKLIDAGTVIAGMAYSGTRPDLGCFESNMTAAAVFSVGNEAAQFSIVPVSSGGLFKIIFPAHAPAAGDLSLFDMSGKKVMDIGAGPVTNGGVVDLRGLGAGSYLCKIVCGATGMARRIVRK